MPKGTQLSDRPTVLNSAYSPLESGCIPCAVETRCLLSTRLEWRAVFRPGRVTGGMLWLPSGGESVLIFVLGKIGSCFVFLNPFRIWLYTLVPWPQGPRGSSPPHCTKEQH